MVPVVEQSVIWDVTEKKVVRGIGRLRQVKSLDNLNQRTFRPGSKLEGEDGLMGLFIVKCF
jgi:hypothetical protein